MGTSAKNALPHVLRRANRRKAVSGAVTTSRKVIVVGEDYTPAQRRMIDARLAEARKGPYHGPFETAEEVIMFIRKEIRNRKVTESK